MGTTASIQALPARVSKAEVKAVAGAFFDSATFEEWMDEDGLVPKEKILSFAETKGISHEKLVVKNITQFARVKNELDKDWENIAGTNLLDEILNINLIEPEKGRFEANRRQQRLGGSGEPVSDLAELMEAARAALAYYPAVLRRITDACGVPYVPYDSEDHTGTMMLAPLKGEDRIAAKARDEYADRRHGPGFAWIYDAVRATAVFDDAGQAAKFLGAMLETTVAGVQIIKLKNRSAKPLFQG